MTDEILLYLRLVMYPLAALGLFTIIISSYQDKTPKAKLVAMIAGIIVIMAIFIIELLLTFRPSLHELVKNAVLTPAITVLAIGVWLYVFKYRSDRDKHLREKNNGYKEVQ